MDKPNHVPPEGCNAAPRYVGYTSADKQRDAQRIKAMKQYAMIIGLIIIGGLGITGQLFPAVELLVDTTMGLLSGDPLVDDFDAKFIKVN